MNLSRKYRKIKQKQSKVYTLVAIVDVIVLTASFMVVLNAI
ncbi:MAG: hypothetical protein ACRDB0_02595 [Paraclostridium sp.]